MEVCGSKLEQVQTGGISEFSCMVADGTPKASKFLYSVRIGDTSFQPALPRALLGGTDCKFPLTRSNRRRVWNTILTKIAEGSERDGMPPTYAHVQMGLIG